MKLYTKQQRVTYKGRKWLITGFGVGLDGQTIYYLKRGLFRTTADETEIKR